MPRTASPYKLLILKHRAIPVQRMLPCTMYLLWSSAVLTLPTHNASRALPCLVTRTLLVGGVGVTALGTTEEVHWQAESSTTAENAKAGKHVPFWADFRGLLVNHQAPLLSSCIIAVWQRTERRIWVLCSGNPAVVPWRKEHRLGFR